MANYFVTQGQFDLGEMKLFENCFLEFNLFVVHVKKMYISDTFIYDKNALRYYNLNFTVLKKHY